MAEILNNFWVLEGLDGSGTTTQLAMLDSFFSKKNIKAFTTCEPTKNETGLLLRKILGGHLKASPTTILHMFAADRDDHISNPEYGIRSHLADGEIVISDRYFFSSYAYQGTDNNCTLIEKLNSSFPFPQGVIFIDTPPDVCVNRIESRGSEKEIYEKYSILVQVRDNYKKCFSSLPEGCRLVSIDGTGSINDIFSEIVKLFV